MKNLAVTSVVLLMLFNTACENPIVDLKENPSTDQEVVEEVDKVVGGQSFCAAIVSTNSSSLNVRTSPTISDNICSTLNKDELVQISLDGSIDGFFKIPGEACNQEEGTYVYVSDQFITFDPSCVFKNAEVTTPPPVVEEREMIAMNWDGKHQDYKKWTAYVYDAVTEYGKDMLASNPDDIKMFCPNYRNLGSEEKKMFWMHLVSSMTEFESGFKPETSYRESFKDNNGNYIISRGLLQLSIESARGYDCTLDDAEDLHSAQKNLECGVRIINRWVRRDGRVAGNVDGTWRGGARYWSVLRKRSGSSSHDKIVSKTSSTSICK